MVGCRGEVGVGEGRTEGCRDGREESRGTVGKVCSGGVRSGLWRGGEEGPGWGVVSEDVRPYRPKRGWCLPCIRHEVGLTLK